MRRESDVRDAYTGSVDRLGAIGAAGYRVFREVKVGRGKAGQVLEGGFKRELLIRSRELETDVEENAEPQMRAGVTTRMPSEFVSKRTGRRLEEIGLDR